MAKRHKRTPVRPQRDNQTLLIAAGGVGLLVVVALIAINVFAQANPTPVNAQGRLWGNANAPVAIEEWSDFQ